MSVGKGKLEKLPSWQDLLGERGRNNYLEVILFTLSIREETLETLMLPSTIVVILYYEQHIMRSILPCSCPQLLYEIKADLFYTSDGIVSGVFVRFSV